MRARRAPIWTSRSPFGVRLGERLAGGGDVVEEEAVARLDWRQRAAAALAFACARRGGWPRHIGGGGLGLFDHLGALEDVEALGLLEVADGLADAGARLLKLGLHLGAGLLDELVAVGLERLQLLRDALAGTLGLAGGDALRLAGGLGLFAVPVEVADQRLDGQAVGVDAGTGLVEDDLRHAEPLGDREGVRLAGQADVQAVGRCEASPASNSTEPLVTPS